MSTNKELDEAVRSLRALILAGENYRQTLAQTTSLGVTETQAVSYLAIHGSRGQTELSHDLGITSSACTALVDRLERQGIAKRFAHPRDRRRLLVRLTPHGEAVVQRSHCWLAAALGGVPAEELVGFAARLKEVAGELRNQSQRIACTPDQ